MTTGYPPLEVGQLRLAFAALDRALDRPITLIVGGGTAMLLAYRLPLVERRIQELAERGIRGAQDALDFFDDLQGSE